MAEDKLFFVGQKAFIDKNGEILVLFTKDLKLDFPGGKIQQDEDNFDEALKREVREETGLEIEVKNIFTRWSLEFSQGKNIGKQVYLVGFRCKYKSGEVKISEEHKEYRWVNKDNYRELKSESDYFKALEEYFKK
jgi:8-oxo-dGTP diphosphatase